MSVLAKTQLVFLSRRCWKHRLEDSLQRASRCSCGVDAFFVGRDIDCFVGRVGAFDTDRGTAAQLLERDATDLGFKRARWQSRSSQLATLPRLLGRIALAVVCEGRIALRDCPLHTFRCGDVYELPAFGRVSAA
jgi:hypothetical protein